LAHSFKMYIPHKKYLEITKHFFIQLQDEKNELKNELTDVNRRKIEIENTINGTGTALYQSNQKKKMFELSQDYNRIKTDIITINQKVARVLAYINKFE
jgi:uncharacterized protein YukE